MRILFELLPFRTTSQEYFEQSHFPLNWRLVCNLRDTIMSGFGQNFRN